MSTAVIVDACRTPVGKLSGGLADVRPDDLAAEILSAAVKRADPEDDRLNVNGGAIAIGHPLGCSGARLVTTLAHELGRRPGARLGLATMCIGVGQGIAALVERAED